MKTNLDKLSLLEGLYHEFMSFQAFSNEKEFKSKAWLRIGKSLEF